MKEYNRFISGDFFPPIALAWQMGFAVRLFFQKFAQCFQADKTSPFSDRIVGDLLLVHGDSFQAEASFQKAIQVAAQQQVVLFELRATMDLSRLWQQQGKRKDAHRLLAEIYNWFTKGLDTPNLMDARELLKMLA